MAITIQATFGPTSEKALHHALDAVPGSIMIGDEQAATLIIPTDHDSLYTALQFVGGLAKVFDLPLAGANRWDIEPDDDFPDDLFGDPEAAEPPFVVSALNLYATAVS